jgi:hypothetical protein
MCFSGTLKPSMGALHALPAPARPEKYIINTSLCVINTLSK